MLFASVFFTHIRLRFIDTKMFVIVTQTLFETRFYLPTRFSTTAQGKGFSAYIALNSHFCSFRFIHVSSPPLVYCGREESFLEP